MPREEPFFRKCCFCIPLQSCLHVWSAIKSIADMSIAVFLILLVIILDSYHELDKGSFSHAHMFIIIIVILFIDSTFMLLLTIGLCTKDLRVLRVFCYYSWFMTSVNAAFVFGFIIYGLVEYNGVGKQVFYPIIVVLLLINSALDVCIIFTLRSEMIKLRNKQQYEFVKMPALNNEEGELTQAEPFQADEENVVM